MAMHTLSELRERPRSNSEWVVENLLRTNRKRCSLLCGDPEAGKSKLARQLAEAVAQGKQFLGRQTLKGKVLYWVSEETTDDTREDFDGFGLTPEEADNILFLYPEPDINNFVALNRALKRHPDIRLVIVETLGDFFDTDDIKNNDENRRKLSQLENEVIEEFPDTAFLVLHYFKKSDRQKHGMSAHKILGGTCLRGKTDAKIYMEQVSDLDHRRVIWATVRKGVAIERTYLNFDSATKTSTLGITVVAEYRAAKATEGANKDQELQDAIFDVIGNSPGLPKRDVIDRVRDRVQCGQIPVSDKIKALIQRQQIGVTKGGSKKNAMLLHLTPIQLETMADAAGVI